MPDLPELTFPVDLRLTGHAVREWHEVGNALVLLTEQSEILRLEPRGVTRLDVAAPPRLLAVGRDRLMLALGDAGFAVVDAAGHLSAWTSKGPFTAEALDDGWWLHVPVPADTGGETERVIELRRPDGRPCVGFRRAFERGVSSMPPPRRMADGWVLTNLVDDDGRTQALSLLDRRWKLVAQSGPTPRADRRVVVIDDAHLLAQTDDGVEIWARHGSWLSIVGAAPCRESWWLRDVLLTDGTDGVVTARRLDATTAWRLPRKTSGATGAIASRDQLLVYDEHHAHWLGLDGAVRRVFDVERPRAIAGREGTLYLHSGAGLWVLAGGEAHGVAVDADLRIETVCGDDVLLRAPDGRCVLVDRDRLGVRFVAKNARFPAAGTRGGLWVVEGERVRGVFAKNAYTVAETVAMVVGCTTRALPTRGPDDAAIVILPDGRAPVLVVSGAPGYGRIALAGGGAWDFARQENVAELVPKVAASVEAWREAERARTEPTLGEIVLAALDVVDAAFDERWTVAIAGTAEPSEMWLHPPDLAGGTAAGAVGIFAGRVNVASVALVPVPTRGDLALRRETLVKAVKEQRVRYERNVARQAGIRALADTLAARLSSRIGRACEVVSWGQASYERTVAPFLRAKDEPARTLVWLRPRSNDDDRDDEGVEVHGGAWGSAGWSTTHARATEVDAMIEPLAEAIERGADLFCVGRLHHGARYRVAKDYEGLKQGEVVTVAGLRDIDNHYGELVLVRGDGTEVAIGGDYSNPETGWVGELYLVFERA